MSGAIELALASVHASLEAKLSARVVSRSFLADLASADAADLRAGVLCVVNQGGGNFADYRGREGELAQLEVTVVGYVLVDEDAPPATVEQAELALLQDVLDWVKDPGALRPLDAVYPVSFVQSQQMEHPYGWVALKLRVHS